MLMLWGPPRSRSTAFYRMMVERGDFTAVFEPFSHAAVFGQAEISGRPLATGPEIIADLRFLAGDAQHTDTYLSYHLPFYQKLYQRRLMV
jgi:hypothetical protein